LKQRSFFTRLTDRVSWLMGTPVNITIWLIIVFAWFMIFATHIVGPDAQFMPRWFTGNSFNFPLNTVTTLAELYIGFLVGAAANRNERHAEEAINRIEKLEEAVLEELKTAHLQVGCMHSAPETGDCTCD
jgi:low affinity Fe/Cu permease